jgi:hypothetical protein
MNPTKAQVDEATDQCVNALTRSAQLRGCFFEDDAGRAEDKRTGLSCPDRQAALAKQCLKRCADYASDTTHLVCAGSYPNTVWHISFGDISGDTGDSARVDLCGPRLRASVSSRLRQPPTRWGPSTTKQCDSRGMSRDEAARYICVGATKFDEMVSDRRMPRSKCMDGRMIWNRLRIEAAFSD